MNHLLHVRVEKREETHARAQEWGLWMFVTVVVVNYLLFVTVRKGMHTFISNAIIYKM